MFRHKDNAIFANKNSHRELRKKKKEGFRLTFSSYCSIAVRLSSKSPPEQISMHNVMVLSSSKASKIFMIFGWSSYFTKGIILSS